MGANIVTLETNGTSSGVRAPNVLKVSAESEEPLEVLIGRTAAGDRVAFRAIYDQTSRIVFSIILRIVRSREVAEDVAQETFVLLWQRADRYQVSRGAPLAWIASIARYRAIDRIRSDRARGVDTAAAPHYLDHDSQDNIAHSDKPCCSTLSDADASLVDTMSVRKLLKRLKPEHQRAILLAYRYGYTHEELAQSMGVPLGTAKSWVRRGLKALKDSLES